MQEGRSPGTGWMTTALCLIFKEILLLLLRKVIFEKQWIFMDAAVGELFGSTFEVDSGGKLGLRKPKNTEDDSTGEYESSVSLMY